MNLLTMLEIVIYQSKLNLTADRDTQNYYPIPEDKDEALGDIQAALSFASTIL